jgi:hypothetical protein
MAGAGGFEPPPSALTVRCPTGWTTPQADDYCTHRREVVKRKGSPEIKPARSLALVRLAAFLFVGWLRCC